MVSATELFARVASQREGLSVNNKPFLISDRSLPNIIPNQIQTSNLTQTNRQSKPEQTPSNQQPPNNQAVTDSARQMSGTNGKCACAQCSGGGNKDAEVAQGPALFRGKEEAIM